jgi:hypothetical protein
MENLLTNILDLLKANKDLPNYQAERRIDIFVNHFLVRILRWYLRNDLVKFVCPEFPLKVKDNRNSKTKNLSTKLDYLCMTDKEIVFVELKTDGGSISGSQLGLYMQQTDWENCKSNYRELAALKRKKTGHQKKYDLLTHALQEVNSAAYSNAPVRVLYISPLPEKQRNGIGNFIVERPVMLRDVEFKMTDAEKIIWNFLCELDLQIFEVLPANAEVLRA